MQPHLQHHDAGALIGDLALLIGSLPLLISATVIGRMVMRKARKTLRENRFRLNQIVSDITGLAEKESGICRMDKRAKESYIMNGKL